MLSPERLETYMRRAAMLGRETVEVPPFVCLFNPGDPLRFFNYAKPLEPVGAERFGAEPDGLTDSLAALRAAFRARSACRASSSSRSTRPIWGRRWSRPGSAWKRAIRCWSARRRRCGRARPSPA